MDVRDIHTLVEYNIWANERILAACRGLTEAAYTRPVTPDPGWGSLNGILVHALDAEYGWRVVLQGQDDAGILDAADFPDVATLQARWDVEHAAWRAYVAGLDAPPLNAPHAEGRPTVAQVIAHVVNHGTQHRSEAAAILTGEGCSPGELDFYLFLRENPPG